MSAVSHSPANRCGRFRVLILMVWPGTSQTAFTLASRHFRVVRVHGVAKGLVRNCLPAVDPFVPAAHTCCPLGSMLLYNAHSTSTFSLYPSSIALFIVSFHSSLLYSLSRLLFCLPFPHLCRPSVSTPQPSHSKFSYTSLPLPTLIQTVPIHSFGHVGDLHIYLHLIGCTGYYTDILSLIQCRPISLSSRFCLWYTHRFLVNNTLGSPSSTNSSPFVSFSTPIASQEKRMLSSLSLHQLWSAQLPF